MAFSDVATVKDKGEYVKEFKKQIAKLKEGALEDFWFFDTAKVEGAEVTVVLLGEVKPAVIKALKADYKGMAIGKCFREGGTVNMSIKTGKMPEATLKSVFKETKTYGYKLVTGDLAPADQKKTGAPDEVEHLRKAFEPLWDEFDRVKGAIGDDNRKTLRIMRGEMDDAMEAGDLARVKKLMAGFEKAMTNFARDAKVGKEPEDPRIKTKAEGHLTASEGRLDKAKAQLDEPALKPLREMLALAAEAAKKSDWAGAEKTLTTFDGELVKALKAALATQSKTAEDKGKAAEGVLTDEDSKKLQVTIGDQVNKIDGLKAAMNPERAKLEKLRETLQLAQKSLAKLQEEVEADPSKEPVLSGAITSGKDAIVKAQKEVEASKKRLDNARKEVEMAAKQLGMMQNVLERRKGTLAGDVMKELAEAQKRASALEKLLDDMPVSLAREAIMETARKMAEANQWREGQLKKEAAGQGHGTGRHGAQTGLERQARRVGTRTVRTDGKVEGVTPDQAGNVAGTAQSITWNKVKITYTEEGGKRVVKDRQKVAQALLASANVKSLGDEASMWANPALEKEAHDTGLAFANTLKAYTHYVKSSGQSVEFKKVVINLTRADGGWGYGLESNGEPGISVGEANAILERFEKGEISMDRLLDEMKTKLYSVDGGAKMLKGCKVIFKRNAGGADWTLLTQYPDKAVAAKAWTPHSSFAANYQMRTAPGGPVTVAGTF